MSERHSDESGLPPLGFREPQIRQWLTRRDGHPPTDAEVRHLYACICQAWARRADRRRRERPDASEDAVAAGVLADVLRDFAYSPEVAAALTLAYALVAIASGMMLASVGHLVQARAQQAEWRRRRLERAALLAYLTAKIGTVPVPQTPGLSPELICLCNVGTPNAARGWMARLEGCAGSSLAYERVLAGLHEHGRAAIAVYPDLARPEPGPPRGLWLTPAEQAAAPPPPPSGDPGSPPAGGGPAPGMRHR